MNRRARLFLATLSGFLLILAFPHYDLSFLVWIAFVPFFAAIHGASRTQAFGLGLLAGFVHHAGTIYWVTNSIHTYGHVPFVPSILVMLLLVLYMALFWGAFAWLLATVSPGRTLVVAFVAPFLWVGLELCRATLFTGFPWNLLGYTQYNNTMLIQIADITGVYGVSFLIMFLNSAMALLLAAWLSKRKKGNSTLPVRELLLAKLSFVLVVAALFYGSWRIDALDAAPVISTVHVALAQGNIEQDAKWDEQYRQSTIDIYGELTREGTTRGAELVIWPETAAPFFFNRDLYWRNQVISFAKENKAAILFGSPEVQYPAPDKPLMYNSVYLLDPEGNETGIYRKRHLVPFGEYVPLQSLLFFLDKLVTGIGDFGRGEDATVFRYNGVPLATVVCYEIIFPDEVRDFVRGGARLLTTVTNDAWFGRSSAPSQHFAMAVFRAVENRVPLARAANTGISGFVDEVGRAGPTTGIFVPAILDKTVEIKENRSFYTSYGDVFALLCVLTATGILGICFYRGEKT